MSAEEEILELRAEMARLNERMAVHTTDIALLGEQVEALAPRIVALIDKVNEFVGRFAVVQ